MKGFLQHAYEVLLYVSKEVNFHDVIKISPNCRRKWQVNIYSV